MPLCWCSNQLRQFTYNWRPTSRINFRLDILLVFGEQVSNVPGSFIRHKFHTSCVLKTYWKYTVLVIFPSRKYGILARFYTITSRFAKCRYTRTENTRNSTLNCLHFKIACFGDHTNLHKTIWVFKNIGFILEAK